MRAASSDVPLGDRLALRAGCVVRELEDLERAAGVAAGACRRRARRSPRAAPLRARRRPAGRPPRAPPRRARRARSPCSARGAPSSPRSTGFSVVAPISVTSPSSTACSTRVLLRLVEAVDLVDEENRAPPLPPSRSRALAITARTSSTRADTAESSSNAAPVVSATMRASVVLPTPGRPVHDQRRDAGPRRSPAGAPSPRRGRAPARRARRASSAAGAPARGAFAACSSCAASAKRSPTRRSMLRPWRLTRPRSRSARGGLLPADPPGGRGRPTTSGT